MASKQFSDQLVALLPRLRRFARGLAGDETAADDLVQEACERALACEHQFESGTRFDSWMFRIVQTIWIDQLRANDTRLIHADELKRARQGECMSFAHAIEARVILTQIRPAIDRLPQDQRTTLTLVVVEGLSYKEAATVSGVPVGTIMSRLSRARRSLEYLNADAA